jgi:hypothetical protein
MKLVMIEMMGGTRSFVGSLVEGEVDELQECVEVKEVIAPGPQGPMVYHIGIKIGTMQVRTEQHGTLMFELDKTSPLMSCYNSAMNQAIEKPTGAAILHYGKSGQA